MGVVVEWGHLHHAMQCLRPDGCNPLQVRWAKGGDLQLSQRIVGNHGGVGSPAGSKAVPQAEGGRGGGGGGERGNIQVVPTSTIYIKNPTADKQQAPGFSYR